MVPLWSGTTHYTHLTIHNNSQGGRNCLGLDLGARVGVEAM